MVVGYLPFLCGCRMMIYIAKKGVMLLMMS